MREGRIRSHAFTDRQSWACFSPPPVALGLFDVGVNSISLWPQKVPLRQGSCWGQFPLSGVTNEVLIQIWNRRLCWLLSPGLGVGGGGRAEQLAPTPEGPGLAERPSGESGLGPMKLESRLARLPAM